MKKTISMAVLALAISFGSIACKKKMTDAELQTKAATAVTANPTASVQVTEGVAHLSGTYATAEERDAAIAELKKIEGVKNVMDMTTLAPVVDVASAVDPAVQQKVVDALKDFPSVNVEVVNGELTLTGNVSPTQARKIKESVDAMQVGKVNFNYTVK